MADAGLLSWLLWDPRIFLSPYCASWQRKHFFLRNTFERKALFLLLLLWYTWVLWQPAVTSSSCTRRWHLSRCREKPCKITRYFILPLPCELQAADGSRVNHIAFSQKSQGCIWHSELPVSAKKAVYFTREGVPSHGDHTGAGRWLSQGDRGGRWLSQLSTHWPARWWVPASSAKQGGSM